MNETQLKNSEPMNRVDIYQEKKLVSIDTETEVTHQILDVLKKNDLTFSNFLGVIDRVKSFYENNGTISTTDTDKTRQSRYQRSGTNGQLPKQ